MYLYRESEREICQILTVPRHREERNAQESSGPEVATALSSDTLEWVTALQQVIREVTSSSNDQAAYKRLRNFSGNFLVPAGEEGFEAWATHIQETLLTWQIPDEEKCRHLLDVLREPVFGVI